MGWEELTELSPRNSVSMSPRQHMLAPPPQGKEVRNILVLKLSLSVSIHHPCNYTGAEAHPQSVCLSKIVDDTFWIFLTVLSPCAKTTATCLNLFWLFEFFWRGPFPRTPSTFRSLRNLRWQCCNCCFSAPANLQSSIIMSQSRPCRCGLPLGLRLDLHINPLAVLDSNGINGIILLLMILNPKQRGWTLGRFVLSFFGVSRKDVSRTVSSVFFCKWNSKKSEENREEENGFEKGKKLNKQKRTRKKKNPEHQNRPKISYKPK